MAPVEKDHVDSDTEFDENELTSVVVTKYQTAADIANKALKKVLDAIADGAKVTDLCSLGDKTIEDLAKGVYNKGNILKGIAFPTCVSPNATICHLSPLSSDPEGATVLAKGDVVRIELGAHIDGYIAQVAHTVVVGMSKDDPVQGRQADVFVAAQTAAEAALRLMRPGNTNMQVTDMIQVAAEDFDCKPVEGMLSHQLQRNTLHGEKEIILNPSETQRKELQPQTFEEGEVYTLDILVSTGAGKPRALETRTTIFKRNPDVTYLLKMKTSREVLSQAQKRFGNMAFSLRHFEDEKKARMGIVECANHGLVAPYQVYYEKEGETVAHLMFTVLLMSTGPLKVTGATWEEGSVKSEKEVKSEQLKELLKQAVKSKSKSKNKKKLLDCLNSDDLPQTQKAAATTESK
ncbi:peptidase M24, structural domain-containing protein [Gaertneriomyces semiglobifer]|nr:peptidase M24, structural domain-containing protein [Gaertneriomyces semiglobifer]